MSASSFRSHVAQVAATIVLFLAALRLNDWLFLHLEFVPGINWVYLPAGMRLVCTLLFAEAGAIGLLLVSWYVSFMLFFPHDHERAFMGGIIAALAPYATYRAAQRFYGMDGMLSNLTPGRLLVLALLYSLASPLLHHLWFAWRGQTQLLDSFLVMFVGDLAGTLIVLYLLKLLLSLVPRRAD